MRPRVLYSVETVSLVKEFGGVRAVDDVSFRVEEGEIFGFLGPNGAGKSTTMMILTTLLKPTSGRALVSGFDVTTQAGQVRRNIGYVQQETTVDEFLTGRENLLFQARLNHIPAGQVHRRIDELLSLIELEAKQHDAVLTYSGGMRKRLDIAGGLLHMPKVLFLDEPTVGLDIQTRRKIWEYVRKIHREFDVSIFVSTHYMEEADLLCDRVGIIDGGKIQVIETPQNMKNSLGKEVISLETEGGADAGGLAARLRGMDLVSGVTARGSTMSVFASEGTRVIPRIFRIAMELNIGISTISLTRPTLDDVFISYTGHDLRDSPSDYNRRREHAKMKRMRA